MATSGKDIRNATPVGEPTVDPGEDNQRVSKDGNAMEGNHLNEDDTKNMQEEDDTRVEGELPGTLTARARDNVVAERRCQDAREEQQGKNNNENGDGMMSALRALPAIESGLDDQKGRGDECTTNTSAARARGNAVVELRD